MTGGRLVSSCTAPCRTRSASTIGPPARYLTAELQDSGISQASGGSPAAELRIQLFAQPLNQTYAGGMTNAAREHHPEVEYPTNAWSCMPKSPPGREPDPMARVVDRLLAQLPGLQGTHEPSPGPIRRSAATEGRAVTGARRMKPPTSSGLWGRAALGVVLGVMMTGWPYFRECGLPLFGYLCAVAAVVVAGGWIAVTAWKLRSGIVHIVGLVLLFWGLVLTADELLPRAGYAAAQATWQCGEAGSGPSWMRWFAPPNAG